MCLCVCVCDKCVFSPHRDPEFVFYDQLKQTMNAYRWVMMFSPCSLSPSI